MTTDSNTPQGGFAAQTQGAFLAPKIIYICYMIGLVFPLAALGGLVYAYIARGQDSAVDTHLNFQIKMFWLGLLAGFIGMITTFLLVGWLLLVAWVVWVLTRCITGLQLASRDAPITEIGPLGFTAK